MKHGANERADKAIRECMDLMASGHWVRGRTHVAIAQRYEVAETTARDWATNASRMLRIAVEADLEEYRSQLVATLSSIVSDARSTGDNRTAVQAIAEQAKLLGLVVQKHEVQAMTPEEADRLIAEAKKLP